jgi:hypothetical protein
LVLSLAVSAGASTAAGQDENDFTLTIDITMGFGEVAIEPTGVTCSTSASPCSSSLPAGTNVTLVASAASGFSLGGWGGACGGAEDDSCDLTLNDNATVTVSFNALSPPPTTTTAPPPPPTTTTVVTTPEPEPEPPPGTPLQRELDRVLAELQLGRILFNVPRTLELGESAVIHVVLSLRETHEELKERITEVGEKRGAKLKVSDEMQAHLSGLGFSVEALTDERQAVSAQETTEWFWQIEPTETGTQTLSLTISAFVKVRGEERKRGLQTFNESLEIRVTLMDSVSGFVNRNWQWLWTTILVPVGAWLLARRSRRTSREP